MGLCLSFSASKHQSPKTQPCPSIHIFNWLPSQSEGWPGLQPSSQKTLKGRLAALGAIDWVSPPLHPYGTTPAWDSDSQSVSVPTLKLL